MSEENKKQNNNPAASSNTKAAKVVAKDIYGDKKRGFKGNKRGRRPMDKRDDFEQRILDIARVTRVMAGGKRMNFRACVAIGDKKGSVAVGMGKGADVTLAVNKAVNRAKKNMIKVPVVNETIPHEVYNKLGAAKIMLKPAKQGRGVISGGVIRAIVELAGIKNITSKTLGTNNKINNARCAIDALSQLRKTENRFDNKTGKRMNHGEESKNKEKKDNENKEEKVIDKK